MNCIACLREVECRIEDGVLSCPSKAVIFETQGNYGSQVLDMESATVEVLICDECLRTRHKCVRAHRATNVVKTVAVDASALISGRPE